MLVVVHIVLGVTKYSSLLYYGYRCLMSFFILLFNNNFSECVLVCLNVFCYWYWSQCNTLGLGCILVLVCGELFGRVYITCHY
jgi:chromate transport protein ChrA